METDVKPVVKKTVKGTLLSVRSFGGYLSHLLFGLAVVGYLWTHNFDEMPASYIGVISGIVFFYYTKDTWRNIKVGTTSRDATETRP